MPNRTRPRSLVSFWFAWTDYHPGTEVYEAPACS